MRILLFESVLHQSLTPTVFVRTCLMYRWTATVLKRKLIRKHIGTKISFSRQRSYIAVVKVYLHTNTAEHSNWDLQWFCINMLSSDTFVDFICTQTVMQIIVILQSCWFIWIKYRKYNQNASNTKELFDIIWNCKELLIVFVYY